MPHLLKVKPEELKVAALPLLLFALLNVLVVSRYHALFAVPSADYHELFTTHFRVSGFDPLTYEALSRWHTVYNIYRHPLLALMLYPLYLVNRGLMALTGLNCAPVLTALLLVACAFYAFVFTYRLYREVIGLRLGEAGVLTALTFSLGYVMVSACVPDHFMLSMVMLTLTLYVAGRLIAQSRPMSTAQSLLLFGLTAGISLSNGLKVFLADAFTQGRRFWHPRHLLAAVLLPAGLMWGAAQAQWYVWQRPVDEAREQVRKARVAEEHRQVERHFRDTTRLTDPTQQRTALRQLFRRLAREKYRRDHRQPWNRHTGRPMGKEGFARWTDVSTPRLATLVHNWWGESIQLHRDYLLEDTLRSRPVIVTYRGVWPYVVEGLMVVLFVGGIVCGRRSRLLWLALSGMAIDLGLHIGLGFGINEVYIMGAHWLYVVPLPLAFLLRRSHGRWHTALMTLIGSLTLYLYAYNGSLLIGYLIS